MMRINDYYLKKLEFDKIQSMLADFAVITNTKERCLKLRPYDDINVLNEVLNEVDEALKIILRMSSAPIIITSNLLPIILVASKGGVLAGLDLYEIIKLYSSMNLIKKHLATLIKEEIDSSIYQKYVEKLYFNDELYKELSKAIYEDGSILDDASLELRAIRSNLKLMDVRIKNKLKEIIAKEGNKLSQATISLRDDRYVVPVRAEYKNSFKGTIRDVSASNQTFYIEPIQISELMNEKKHLIAKEKEEEERILRMLSKKVAENSDEIKNNFLTVVDIDFIFAKANLANKMHASRVSINTSHHFNLINAYHPLLNVPKVIPNNVNFKENLGIVITGPNTGGKTVLLKTVGLLALMTKYGLLIPADAKSDIMIFDTITCDIGDDQSIQANLSTFSSHMKNIINIINYVTRDSLVLFDEIGGGTDPFEGSNLAIAILSYLLDNKISFITTTHYSELKAFAYNDERVVNASMEFDDNTLLPTYKLRIGIPGSSNAFNIARNLGLKEEIIEAAERKSATSKTEVKNLVEKLEKMTDEVAKKEEELENTKSKYNEAIALYDKKMETIENDRLKIMKNAEKEAEKIISKVTIDANNLLEELKEKQKASNIKLHETIAIKKELDNLEIPKKEEITMKKRDLRLGDDVYVKNYEQYGQIIKMLKPHQYEVLVGNATLVLNDKQLDLVENLPKKTTDSSSRFIKKASKQSLKLSLDLRGERYEDAKIKLEKYFDDCLYSGVKQATIIHGFGTGTIRNLVQSFVKANPHVESYRYGGAGEGGQGSTIVYFK